ncbi:MAG: selenium cofactor biosynthesis protein YqeC [Halobellus sp.]
MDVVTALRAREGVTCMVGAGGKKTTMQTLAGDLEGAVVTATVRIPIFDDWVGRVVVTDDPVAAVDEAEGDPEAWPLGVVPEREREDRYFGYELDVLDELAALDVPVLAKADGARMRRLKAPSENEPRIPGSADTVVPIASAHVVGEPLSDALVHRVDEVAALTGLDPGDEIRPADVAAVLASEEGGLKGVPDDATPIPLLNMVDDDELEASAREVAAEIHERADVPRVVLAEMRADDPIVDVV